MAARKPFLLRVDPGLLSALERWAADDLRSVNGQIEFLLREALRRAGRKVVASDDAPDDRPVHPERTASNASAESKDETHDAPALIERGRRIRQP